VALLLPIAFWGWRLMAHRGFDAEKLRFGAWLAGMALAAGFASGFPVTIHWPLPTGLGGVIGDWIFGVPAILFFARSSQIGQALLTGLLGSGAFVALVVASGFFCHVRPEERPAGASSFGETTGSFGAGLCLDYAALLPSYVMTGRIVPLGVGCLRR